MGDTGVAFMRSGLSRIENRILFALIVSTFSGTLCSCSSNANSSLVTTCVLPSDQLDTMKGHWQTLPAPIAINVSSNFSAGEQVVIQNAANTWNTFFNSTQTITVINPGSGDDPAIFQRETFKRLFK